MITPPISAEVQIRSNQTIPNAPDAVSTVATAVQTLVDALTHAKDVMSTDEFTLLVGNVIGILGHVTK